MKLEVNVLSERIESQEDKYDMTSFTHHLDFIVELIETEKRMVATNVHAEGWKEAWPMADIQATELLDCHR